MTKKPGLKARSKSIKAALTAARAGQGKADDAPTPDVAVAPSTELAIAQTPEEKSDPAVEAASAVAPTPVPEIVTETIPVPAPTENRVPASKGTQGWHYMPSNEGDQRILKERAEIYARPPKPRRATQNGDAFVQINLGGPDRFGIPFEYADEIVVAGEITPVPGTPGHVAGVVNLRGTLLTVVDIRPLLALDASGSLGSHRVVVVSADGMRFGVLVAEVDGTVSFGAETLARPISGETQGKNFIRGIHGGRIAVIDISALMAASALIVDQARDR